MFCRTVLATTAVLLIGGSGANAKGQELDRPVVAILNFTNSALVDHELYEPFTVGIAGMLLSDLRRNGSIELVERERIRDLLDEIDLGSSGSVDPSTAVRAGRILGAHHVIVGGFVIDREENLRLDARAVNVETSRIEHVETVEDDADNLLRAVRRLAEQLSADMDLPMDELDAPETGTATSGQLLANLKYARALLEEDQDNAPGAAELYSEFLAETPLNYAIALRREAEERVRSLDGMREP